MNDIELVAGKELDALIAEKVMGLHVEWRNGQPWWVGKDLPGSPYILGDGLFGHAIEPYSTDIAAAWRVVEKLAKPLKVVWTGQVWVCEVFGQPCSEEAKTAPLAICRAVLKAAEDLKAAEEGI